MQVQAAWLRQCFGRVTDLFRCPKKKDAPAGASSGFKDRSLNLEHFPPLAIQPGVRVVLRRAMKALLVAGVSSDFDDRLVFCFAIDVDDISFFVGTLGCTVTL